MTKNHKFILLLSLSIITLCSVMDGVAQNSGRKKLNRKDNVEFGDEVVKVEKVTVKGKRNRYNRDNAAVDLVKRLIASRDSLNPFLHKPYVEYETYEKIVISLNNYKDRDSTEKLAFLNEHKMINPQSGKTILPVSLREKITFHQLRNKGKSEKKSILYANNKGVDSRFSQSTVLAFLDDAMPNIDIFKDHIYLMQRQFISPLSKRAYNFYKFFLAPDTIDYKGKTAVTLEFFPFSKNSLALRGKFIVEIDTTGKESPFIRYINLSVPNSADANFLSNIYLEQSIIKDSSGFRVIEWDSSSFDASLSKRIDIINIRRSNNRTNYIYTTPEEQKRLAQLNRVHSGDSLDSYIIEYGVEHAPMEAIEEDKSKKSKRRRAKDEDTLRKPTIKIDQFEPTSQEEQVNALTKRMKKMPLYVIFEEAMLILVEGYFQTSKKSYFDVGPLSQFIASNSVEGTRIALGGMTTPNLSPHIFFDGMVAYGFRDNKVKYDLSLEYSFDKKKEIYKEFPVHSIRATYTYDIHRFGQGFDKPSREDIFSMATRSGDNNLTYIRLAQIRYIKEWRSNLSLSVYARQYNSYETPVMSFAPTPGAIPYYSMSEAEVRLRYAPGEKIYQSRRSRRSLNKYIPTFGLSHVSGFKGVLGGDYTRNLTELSGFGRINIQPLGYIEINAKVGGEWGSVPYMLLPHPQTNMTYLTGDESTFSLMQPLEYIYDKYIYLGLDYYLDGLIFSRLPLIKHLNLREVFSFRGIYGTLGDKNNPTINTSLIPLPASSSPIGREPYIEVGVGIDNIFKFFRIDYVWRITYLDKADVQGGALLFNFAVKF